MPEAGDENGRIPFRLRIGVTGHRDIDPEPLVDAVRAQVARLRGQLVMPAATPLRLAAVSQLADGADRLVVREVFAEAEERGEEARLEVVLPLPRDEYAAAQGFSDVSRAEFEELLARATLVTELHGGEASGRAYEAAGREVVGRCDALIALWNGGPTGGAGGTAETLLAAAAAGKPCVWISTVDGAVADNLAPGAAAVFQHDVAERAAVPPDRRPPAPDLLGDVWSPFRDSIRSLDELNRERLPRDWAVQLERELGAESESAYWMAPFFLRSSLLAARWQSRFMWSARLISLLAIVSAFMLAVSVTLDESRAWHWAEAAAFMAIVVVLGVVRRLGFHRRWLTYRFLAERLRSAHYLAIADVDFRRTPGPQPAHVQHTSADWLLRAFEEVWDGRGQAEEDPERVRSLLADEWVGGQISYYRRKAARHRRADRILSAVIGAIFLASILFAVLDAAGLLEREGLFLSITLPVIGASLGALLSLQQHRPLGERYEWMAVDLASTRRMILAAAADSLGPAALEAARVISEESGDWFGSMWFLDVEQP